MNIMTEQLLIASISLVACIYFVDAGEIPITFDLTTGHDIEISAMSNGVYEIKTTGEDPYILSRPIKQKIDHRKQYVLAFDYFCAQGIDGIQLFYGPPIKAGQSAQGPELLSSEGWTSYSLNIMTCQESGSWRAGYNQFRLDFGRASGREIQVQNIHLREPSGDELAVARNVGLNKETATSFAESLRSMVNAKHDCAITRVAASNDKITVELTSLKDISDCFICEVPIFQAPAGLREFVWKKSIKLKANQQTVSLDRFRADHDRVFSSWIIMRKTSVGFEPVSHQRFADTIPCKWDLTRDHAPVRKGLPGINGNDKEQIADYRALGIRHCTKNILLSNLVKKDKFEGAILHEFNGRTVYVNPSALRSLDASMMAMEKLKIVVSAIILIPKGSAMSHPDCTAQGIYAMANVVNEEGWNIYASGLDFLAQRYTRADRKYGRITHWIMHNEVDAGWVWTNAGDKPLDVYLDLYYRSMRTAHSVIRRYGNAGNVLMSLTHYWTARHNSKCYPPRSLIDLLNDRSRLEGDFDWGLAYHPYPENLRDPRTWLDKKIDLTFDTQLITPKNLEVLVAYMKQDHMLYDGRIRTIVLSEQGSNSRDQTEKSYRDQAAGLVYTWMKLEQTDAIESYVHHRWMDHPKEGGLNLGFRRREETSTEPALKSTAAICSEFQQFGITTSPDKTKKPSWDIYRILDTPEQIKAVKWAKTVIPADYFKEVTK